MTEATKKAADRAMRVGIVLLGVLGTLLMIVLVFVDHQQAFLVIVGSGMAGFVGIYLDGRAPAIIRWCKGHHTPTTAPSGANKTTISPYLNGSGSGLAGMPHDPKH